MGTIGELAKIWTRNGQKSQKIIIFKIPSVIQWNCHKIQNAAFIGYKCWEKLITDIWRPPFFGLFSIQIAENAWKPPFFDTPYLCNRFELKHKWAHYENKISQGYNIVKPKEYKTLTQTPPPCPLHFKQIFVSYSAQKWKIWPKKLLMLNKSRQIRFPHSKTPPTRSIPI